MHEDVIDSLDVFSVVPVRFPLTETEGGDNLRWRGVRRRVGAQPPPLHPLAA